MLIEVVAILVSVVLMAAVCGSEIGVGTVLTSLLDFPSLISLLVLSLPILLRNGMWKDFVRGFKLLKKSYTCSLAELKRALDVVELMQRQILYAGVILTAFAIIIVLGFLQKPEIVGVNIAVALITVLYAAVLEMLLLPVQIEVKRRIIDYMEAE
ncbi:MAG: hypothetical protein E7289_07190 [Lachnospiraceae bacterium]|nr:hypothetical protein [Lachnospiraceae bacterium]